MLSEMLNNGASESDPNTPAGSWACFLRAIQADAVGRRDKMRQPGSARAPPLGGHRPLGFRARRGREVSFACLPQSDTTVRSWQAGSEGCVGGTLPTAVPPRHPLREWHARRFPRSFEWTCGLAGR
jgi:hypothetical protein